MRRFAQRLVLLCPLLLMGCSFVSSAVSKTPFVPHRDKEYLSATSVPPLSMPPGVNSTGFDTQYPVSDHYYPYGAKNVSIYPPTL